MQGRDLPDHLSAFLEEQEGDLVEFRRDLHRNPELAFAEHRTTRQIALKLREHGLSPVPLRQGTGLTCDVGPDEGPTVALRADIDALPLQDEKDVEYRSTVPGTAHACGHDVHTAVVLGAGLFLAQQAKSGLLPGRVRLVFQPAEELPGGAREVIAQDRLVGVDRIFALHCDPRIPVGKVGLRSGAITAACDRVLVRLSGAGGHTARPHLTSDLVYALGKVVTELPAVLSRRVDPRSSLSMVWGRISAGSPANAIPDDGVVEGTVRCFDGEAWRQAPELIREAVNSVVYPYGATAELSYQRGVPPTVNELDSVQMLRDACGGVLGEDAVVPAPQSLGGEDFAWYLEQIPGAYARLGTHWAEGGRPMLDLHRGTFDVDERAIGLGVRLLSATAMTALWQADRPSPAEPVEGSALA
jgi:amidohydrolase